MDTFQDKELIFGPKTCICSFTLVENDGLVDVQTAKCNSKCSGKDKIRLGGPLPTTNLYNLEIEVSKGSVTVTKITATLATEVNIAPKNNLTSSYRSLTSARKIDIFNPKMGEYCEKFVSECLDRNSFPNIGQAFRGYNLILGDPLNYDGDPGFESHIFDEASERNGRVRFGNTAGNDLNRCDGSVRADFIETAEEFLESTMRSQYSKKWFQIGTEIDLTASAGVKAEGNGNANAEGGQVPFIPGLGVGGEVGGSVSGHASVEASVTIPPLYKSVSSNSQVMTEIAEGLESNQISVTRSSFSCHEYEFEITESQHPAFTAQFKAAAQELETCLLQGPPFNTTAETDGAINGTSKHQDDCAMKFIRNYGTHYIKEAMYGSKMSLLTVLDSKAVYNKDKEQLAKCAKKRKTWSFLGIFGGGSEKEDCMNDLLHTESGSKETVIDEIVVTVGSRPKGDYSEWAEQRGKPEIIHKTLAPISDLFNTNFMQDMNITFEANGVATIKPVLDHYLLYYCGLFRSHCNFVSVMPYCPGERCRYSTSKCGHYTGHVDVNFLPHGEGTLILEDEVLQMIWVHGCTAG